MPSISAITPSTFDSGRSVTLSGSGFGASQGSVLIAGQAQTVTSWSDTSITFSTIRAAQSLGACRVDVVAGAAAAYTPTVIVTNQTELNTELAKSAAQLSGKVIGVQYNATPYVITRTGTPNLKDKDFGVLGLVICAYGTTKPVFSSLDFQGTKNLTLHELEVYAAINGTLITLRSGVENFTLSACKIHSDYYDPNGTYAAYAPSVTQATAITSISAGSQADISNIYIKDCEIYDVLEVLTTSQTLSGDFHFIGNHCHTFYTGALSFSAGLGSGTTKINWNTFYEAYGKSTDANIGLGTPPHVDFIQARAVQRDWTLEIIGNLMFQGNCRNQATQCIFLDDQHISGFQFVSGGSYPLVAGNTIVGSVSGASAKIYSITLVSGSWANGDAAGFLYYSLSSGTFQAESVNVGANIDVATLSTGVIIKDESHFYTATIKGNVCVTNSTHGISVLQAKNCVVTGNTVIHADNTATIGAKINIGSGTVAYPNGEGGGNIAKNNVAHSVTAGTEINNNEYGAYTTVVLTDRFDGPSFTGLNSRAAVLAALSMKAAPGPLDQTINIGAVGSGYVDYTARTVNGAME